MIRLSSRVNSLDVVVGDVLTKSPMQMPLAQYDHAVEELSAANRGRSICTSAEMRGKGPRFEILRQ
jgi:hypothetical protein